MSVTKSPTQPVVIAPPKPKVEPAKPKVVAAKASAPKTGWKPKAVSAKPTAAAHAPARKAEPKKAAAVTAVPKGEAGQYQYYKDLIDRSGGRFRTGAEQRNILSFRTPTSTKVNGGQGRYDDSTVMLWKDSAGRPHVRTYRSNTDPSSRYEGTYGQDANHDGRLDLGRIPAGTYDFSRSYSSHLGNVLRPTSDFRVDRDSNHDGVFNDGSKQTYGGGSMLFHAGGTTMTGSAGCQTMTPADFQRFWKDLGNYKGPIAYTLVNGKNAAPGGVVKVAAPEETFSKTGLSLKQLTTIMPGCPEDRAKSLLPHLNKAMKEFGINTPQRAAAFLAQLAHESGQLKYFEELASGRAYEGRSDLGNTHPGDGVRFKGRGPIQLTGRANYARASEALGVDLVSHPELASRPDIGFRIAGWFWKTHGLNELADKGNFSEITHRINGGYNGAASRNAYYATAQRVLGGGLDGGPVSSGDTVPSSFNRSNWSGEASGYRAPPAGNYDNNSFDSYGGRTRDPGVTDAAATAAAETGENPWDLFFELLLMGQLMEMFGDEVPPQLMKSPKFQAFIKKQPGMANWKPGDKVPKEMVTKFFATELAAGAKERGGGPQALKDASAALRAEFTPTVAPSAKAAIRG